MQSITHQKLDDEDDREIGGEEVHAAPLACHAHDRLADEGQVDEASVGVAEGEAEQLLHQRVLVLRGGAVIFEVFFVFCESEKDQETVGVSERRTTQNTNIQDRKSSGVFSLKHKRRKKAFQVGFLLNKEAITGRRDNCQNNYKTSVAYSYLVV